MIYSAFKMAGLAPPLLVSKSRPQFADSNAEQMLRIFQGAVFSNPGPDMVKAKPTMHHHHDCGSDNDFDDPASWNRASYNHHSCDDLESSPDVSNPYRAAAIFHLQLMFAVDEFLTDAPDARVAVVAVAVVLSWPSTRGLTVGNIATRLACTRPARRLNRRRLIRHPEETMKIRFLVALVGLAVSFAFPTFAQQKDTVDPKIAQQIRALETKFDEAYNKNDAPAVAALYTEDAFYGTPHGGFHGRQAIEEDYARHSFQDYHSNNLFITVDRAIAVGNEVHATGRWSVTYQPQGGGTIKGRRPPDMGFCP
jgi:uncharacterized protein (TIGR02246 family)